MPDSRSKHAVLFGGAGFIGSELINALTADHWQISVITKRPHRHRNLLVIPSLKIIEAGDLSDETIENLISESDTVVNLIGILNETSKDTFKNIHTQLPERIAKACLKNKANRLINISALGASADAPSEYLKSRGLGEQALKTLMENGLNCTIIRPSIVFGPKDSFSRLFHQLLSNSPFLFPLVAPNAIVQPVYVKDVVRCIHHAISVKTPENGSFDIAGPQSYKLREFIGEIDRIGGMRHRIIGLSHSFSKLFAALTQFAPGKPLTPDNLRSLQVPSTVRDDTPTPYGIQATRFETVASDWLSRQPQQLDAFRQHAGR